MDQEQKNLAAFTIGARNYLAEIRTLSESFLKFHPKSRFFVFLLDEVNGAFDPAQENFELLELKDLAKIVNKQKFLFNYNITEASTAVKPFVFEHIFETFRIDKLLYLDPDIFITKDLGKIETLLDDYSMVLTPHLTKPIPVNEYFSATNEVIYLKVGAYNLGFLGLAKTSESLNFLHWWQERLAQLCVNDYMLGLFVDQKWLDLVHALFDADKIYILKDPEFNVAYWNLQEKRFSKENGTLLVDQQPLAFFHFSGFTFGNIESISKYQKKFKLDEFEGLRELFENYKNHLIKNGFGQFKHLAYSYDFYSNGKKIWDFDRKLYWLVSKDTSKYDCPYNVKSRPSFYRATRRNVFYQVSSVLLKLMEKKAPRHIAIVTQLAYKALLNKFLR